MPRTCRARHTPAGGHGSVGAFDELAVVADGLVIGTAVNGKEERLDPLDLVGKVLGVFGAKRRGRVW